MSWTLGNKLDFDKWRTDISGVRNNIHQDKKKKKAKGKKPFCVLRKGES